MLSFAVLQTKVTMKELPDWVVIFTRRTAILPRFEG
jgi:hypothetical protein